MSQLRITHVFFAGGGLVGGRCPSERLGSGHCDSLLKIAAKPMRRQPLLGASATMLASANRNAIEQNVAQPPVHGKNMGPQPPGRRLGRSVAPAELNQ
jgi:hypothetical protein